MSARLKTWKGGLGKKKRWGGQPVTWTNFLPELKLLERENNHVLEMMCGHVSLSLKRKMSSFIITPFEL